MRTFRGLPGALRVTTHALARVGGVTEFDLDAEVVSEEDAATAGGDADVRAIEPYREPTGGLVKTEVRTAAIAAAGGALAGAVTVAAVRAVSAAGSRGSRPARRLARRRNQPQNVLASRSFLVDVHLLGR
jgi:hypothetical protein